MTSHSESPFQIVRTNENEISYQCPRCDDPWLSALEGGNRIAVGGTKQVEHHLLVDREADDANAAVDKRELWTTGARRSPIATAAAVRSVIPGTAGRAVGKFIQLHVAVELVAAAANTSIAAENPRFVPVEDASPMSPLRDRLFTHRDGVAGTVRE